MLSPAPAGPSTEDDLARLLELAGTPVRQPTPQRAPAGAEVEATVPAGFSCSSRPTHLPAQAPLHDGKLRRRTIDAARRALVPKITVLRAWDTLRDCSLAAASVACSALALTNAALAKPTATVALAMQPRHAPESLTLLPPPLF